MESPGMPARVAIERLGAFIASFVPDLLATRTNASVSQPSSCLVFGQWAHSHTCVTVAAQHAGPVEADLQSACKSAGHQADCQSASTTDKIVARKA
jgi:hypothetical protein